MVRSDTYNIIHATNYAALCIAILRPSPVTVEDAFDLYEGQGAAHGCWRHVNHKERVSEMASLREEGYSWSEIGQALGLKAPQCYYSRYRHLLKNRLVDFGKVDLGR